MTKGRKEEQENRDQEEKKSCQENPTWFNDTVEYICNNILSDQDTIQFKNKITSIQATNWQNLYHNFSYFLLNDICICHKSIKEEINSVKKLHKTKEQDNEIWLKAYSNMKILGKQSFHHDMINAAIYSIPLTNKDNSLVNSIACSLFLAADLLARKEAKTKKRLKKYHMVHLKIHAELVKKISNKLIQLLEN